METSSQFVRHRDNILPEGSGRIRLANNPNDDSSLPKVQLPAPLPAPSSHYGFQSPASHMMPPPLMEDRAPSHYAGMPSRMHPPQPSYQQPPPSFSRRSSSSYSGHPYSMPPHRRRDSMQLPSMQVPPLQYPSSMSTRSPTSPTDTVCSEDKTLVTRKRSRHAWPADMTRQIINVLLDEFLNDPTFRTTIYRSRDERDSRFLPSGRSILEEYNKVQNIRRRYFIPLSYLLQWDQLRQTSSSRSRQHTNIEKKLAKPLERSRLQMIFCSSMKTSSSSTSLSTAVDGNDDMSDAETEATSNGKPVFELDIFVTELKQRDPQLWARGYAAFQAWISRKCSIDYILNF
ncbi:hypothetical protein GGI15_001135 [Coemansia interrupta]|uniref:Uncharacterized protein n=1 Tax=Coemansia interrupta TaxID=1126814 RepID=A0A9W8HNC2_9FUNG|nr:hypothetical protein GGI15_001135 [Coemansia interrupta]